MDITVEQLTKRYGPQTAVDNISFELKTGEILGFLGPNGAGKSTTMKMMTCYLAPTTGDIVAMNRSVFKEADEFRRRIGCLPEHNPLYLDMYIDDFLRFSAKLQRVPSRELDNRIREMIRLCGLNAEKHKKIKQLSKGYRQRVGLAQAMIHNPDVLILDEPTTGLDPNQIVEIRELIRSLGRDKTILLSTHILSEVEATCDRIIIINSGKLVANGTPETLRRQMQGEGYLQLKLDGSASAEDMRHELERLAETSVVEVVNEADKLFHVRNAAEQDARKPVFDLCVDKGWYLLELRETETKLEDIFSNLTR